MAGQPGLDDATGDKRGQTRDKEGNTRIDTLRQTYGNNFAAGMRGDRICARCWTAQEPVDYLRQSCEG
jgi:hypothetical protein